LIGAQRAFWNPSLRKRLGEAMLFLEVKAPFATFRNFTAGTLRPTAGFMTPSAAYGLLLNLAGIEMRHDDGKSVMTVIRNDLPKFRIALGAPSNGKRKPAVPLRQSIYQQLHNYPVGKGGKPEEKEKIKRLAENAKENKYNIAPVRRAFLSDFHAFIAVDADEDLYRQVEHGLSGKSPRAYGLPFLGDNNFLPDVIRQIDTPTAFWWERVTKGGLRENTSRLTIFIDRADMSRTKSDLFAPSDSECSGEEIPESAWVDVGY
jgi:CRISPR-associated protein Cas5t